MTPKTEKTSLAKEQFAFLQPQNDVLIQRLSVTYEQPSDSCEEDGGGQTLKISTDDAGGGAFAVIETERWAVEPEDAEWLAQVIKEICKMAKSPVEPKGTK